MLRAKPSGVGVVVVPVAVACAVLLQPLESAARARREIVVTSTIQAAVDRAKPGDVIVVPPGVYRENVLVTTDNLTIQGSAAAVLDGEGLSAAVGIRVAPTAPATRIAGFTLRGLTIRNYARSGVVLLRTDDYRLEHSVYEHNTEYGPFPIFSTRGVIEGNRVSGSNDAGIYVGRSSDATIRNNLVSDCTSGIQIENSQRISIAGNEVSNNSLGIVSLVVPGSTGSLTTDVTIASNRVIGNNRANPVTDPRELLSRLPAGMGILVVGGVRVIAADNVALHNDSAGITVAQVPPDLASLDPHLTPFPAQVRVLSNVARQNGDNPDPRLAPFPGADLLWDLSGSDVCFAGNGFASGFPQPLPSCGAPASSGRVY